MSNPLLEPIHGVSLQDYAAVTAKMAAGIDVKDICAKLGIEPAVFEEASTLWVSRMQEDTTWEVTTLFGQYFGEADSHPKLSELKAEVSSQGLENFEKMKTDRYFYEELNGARLTAYNYGLDGAQWILDTFGVNLTDFQTAAMQWAQVTQGEDFETMRHYMDFMEAKQSEYAAKFAADQGGNIADDVEF